MMFSVSVAPDMQMYSLLISQGYDLTFALCEFIDNSIHAHQLSGTNNRPLEVSIEFFSNEEKDSEKRNSIVITDNGPGISRNRLQSALTPAKPPGQKGLSEFGIGMKAASVWFAEEWTLRTSPKNEPVRYETTFNLPALLADGSDKIKVTEEKEDKRLSGTSITLRSLRRDIGEDQYDTISSSITEIYQRFISGSKPSVCIRTSFNGESKRLKFTQYSTSALVAPKHVKRGSKTYEEGKEKTWEV